MMITIFPKMKYAPRITYIKKIKEDVVEEDKKIDILANNYELSKREVKQLLSLV
jgi:hypothetical protein